MDRRCPGGIKFPQCATAKEKGDELFQGHIGCQRNFPTDGRGLRAGGVEAATKEAEHFGTQEDKLRPSTTHGW